MSLPRYPEYKDSGVAWLGRVPKHWDLRRVGYYFSERREKVSDKDFPPLSVTKNGVVPQLETAAKTDDGDNRKLVRVGDFVINGRSDRKGSSGASEADGSVSLINTVLTPTPEMSGRFAHHLFRSVAFQEEYYRFGKGIVADLWSTNYSEMRNITLAVPEYAEQVAIAAFLDRETAKIDALIAEQEELLALLAEKRQVTISHAVTRGIGPGTPLKESGIPWLGQVPAHWSLPPLYMRYSSELGKMLDASRITGQHLVPYLRNVDVQWDAINYSELPSMDIEPSEYARYTVRDGDLLVCEGGDVGRAAVVQIAGDVIGFQKALHRLRALTGEECPRYMFYTFAWASNAGAFSGEGQSTIAHLTGEQLRKYRFPKPSKAEQESIAAFLDAELVKLSALKTEAESAIGLLKERRTALITAAVTGQIDVRGAVEAQAA